MTTVLDVNHSSGKKLREKVARKKLPIHGTSWLAHLMNTMSQMPFGPGALNGASRFIAL